MIPFVFCLTLLLNLPRLDSVTVEGLLLPDPGKGQQMLVGNGRYTVAKDRRVMEILLRTQNIATPGQVKSVFAEYNAGGEWRAKLPLPPGDYDCWVELTTTDEPGDSRQARSGIVSRTKVERVRVK